MAEPAPTRRSSRTSATPVQASSETPGASRAELRRRAGESAPERPAVVWGRRRHLRFRRSQRRLPPQPPLRRRSPPSRSRSRPTTPGSDSRCTGTGRARRCRFLTRATAVEAPRRRDRPAAQPPRSPQPADGRAAGRAAASPSSRPRPLSRSCPTSARPSRHRSSPRRCPTPSSTPAEPFELLEPVVGPAPAAARADLRPSDLLEPVPVAEPEAEPIAEPRPEASDVDEFEAAARLFSFTGETPIQSAAEPQSEQAADAPRRPPPLASDATAAHRSVASPPHRSRSASWASSGCSPSA